MNEQELMERLGRMLVSVWQMDKALLEANAKIATLEAEKSCPTKSEAA